MKQCTTENNATLILNEATFAECLELQAAIMEEAKKLKLDVGNIEIEDIKGFETASVSKLLDNFKTLFLDLMTSKRFEKSLWNCLKHCTYNDVQITMKMFEDMPEARADYYQIIKECVEINIAPFLKSLTSQLSALLPTPTNDNQISDLAEKKTD